MRAYTRFFQQPTSINFGKALKTCARTPRTDKVQLFYAKLKLIVIADLICFTKKCDREDSGIKRRDMLLQRNLASERAKTADNELVKLAKLEKNCSVHMPRTSWEGRKS